MRSGRARDTSDVIAWSASVELVETTRTWVVVAVTEDGFGGHDRRWGCGSPPRRRRLTRRWSAAVDSPEKRLWRMCPEMGTRSNFCGYLGIWDICCGYRR